MSKMPGSIGQNERGAGIFLAGFAMAALAGAGFMLGSMYVNAQKVVKKDSRIASYQHLVETVRKNLYAGNNCTQVLTQSKAVTRDLLGQVTSTSGALNLTNAFLNETTEKVFERGVEITLPIKLHDQVVNMEPDWDAKTGTSVKSMRLIFSKFVTYPPPNATIPREVRFPDDPLSMTSTLKTLQAAEAYLVIEPDHQGINVWLPENRKYWIKLFTYFDPVAKTIHSCYDPTSEAAFCTEVMNGVYVHDSAVPAEQRCQPDIGCFTYKHGLVDAGEVCPSIYTETYIGGTSNGDVSMPAQKMCTWCPRAALPAVLGVTTVNDLLATDYGSAEVCYDDGTCETISTEDLAQIDCSSPNPWSFVQDEGGMSKEQIAWEAYLEIKEELPYMSAEDQAKYAECLTKPPPCWDNPATCEDECTGDTLACDPTCFIAGTRISMADGSEKSIEDILKGDIVISEGNKVEVATATMSFRYKGLIYGINGGRTFFTPNHPFLTLEGWKSLNPQVSMREIPGLKVTLLEEGDVILRRDGIEQVYFLNSSPFEGRVYNFSVTGSHSYIAEDYVVHNVAADSKGPIP